MNKIFGLRKPFLTDKGKKDYRKILAKVSLFLSVIIAIAWIADIKVAGKNHVKIASSISNGESLPTDVAKSEATSKESACLDPGHGGNDVGATYGKVNESDVNLAVALEVRRLLLADGLQVYMTRSDDTYVAKRARANYCNSVNGSILVAIHHNSYTQDKSVDYATALYYKDSDQSLASHILDSVSGQLSIKNQGIAKFDDSELWIAKMPAILSEGFFITNKTEYNQIAKGDYTRLKEEAQGIETGIKEYFKNPTETQSAVSADSLIIDRAGLGD